jgi:hypothetical protein
MTMIKESITVTLHFSAQDYTANEYAEVTLGITEKIQSLSADFNTLKSTGNVLGNNYVLKGTREEMKDLIYRDAYDDDTLYNVEDNGKLHPESKTILGFLSIYTVYNSKGDEILSLMVQLGGTNSNSVTIEFGSYYKYLPFKVILTDLVSQLKPAYGIVSTNELWDKLDENVFLPIGWYTWINKPFFTAEIPGIRSEQVENGVLFSVKNLEHFGVTENQENIHALKTLQQELIRKGYWQGEE